MLINSLTGAQISRAVVPDSAEIYCSPIVSDLQNNGQLWVLYGTGGETLPGNFYACPLSSLAQGDISNSLVLASDNTFRVCCPCRCVQWDQWQQKNIYSILWRNYNLCKCFNYDYTLVLYTTRNRIQLTINTRKLYRQC